MSDNGRILVVGAGSAGASAALAAVRAGADLVLVEKTDRVGGIVSHSLIHTLGGLFDAQGAVLNPGLPAELIERLQQAGVRTAKRRIGRLWTFAAAPETYQSVVEKWLAEESRIHLLRKAQVDQIVHAGGHWRAEISVAGNLKFIEADTVIDATGDAVLIRQIAPACVEDDAERAAGGLIFILNGVASDALRFPKNTDVLLRIKRAAQSGELPAAAAAAWLDQGSASGEAYVKLLVSPPKNPSPGPRPQRDEDQQSIQSGGADIPVCPADQGTTANGQTGMSAPPETLAARDALVTFLQRQESFRDVKILRTGALGLRDGGRIRGAYRLTTADLDAGKKFPDAVCCGAWPMEYWDAERGATLMPVGGDGTYEIPLSALRVKGLPNAWAAGKCLSADRAVQASARVVGTCWATGAAAGRAAARME